LARTLTWIQPESLARVLLLLFFVAMMLALLKGGWPGVRKWFKVKFVGTA
jgi:hypothetical protein